MNATRGRATTRTDVWPAAASAAAMEGVTRVPAVATRSPSRMREPAGEVPAKRRLGGRTICSSVVLSALTTAFSMAMAVSKPSGIPTPVFANCHSTSRVQPEMSGIEPSACSKSLQRRAIESMLQVRQLGIVTKASASSASVRPNACSSGTSSTPGANAQWASIVATASSRLSSMWLE